MSPSPPIPSLLPRSVVAVACLLSTMSHATTLKLSYALAYTPVAREWDTSTSAPAAPMGVMHALNLALGKDLRYAASLAAFRAAQEQVPQARAGFRPQVSLNGAFGASNGRAASVNRSEEVAENRTDSVLVTDTRTHTEGQTQSQQDGLAGSDTRTRSSSNTVTQSTLSEQSLENLASNSWQSGSRASRGLNANAELSLRWAIYRPGMERQLELSQIRVAQAEVQLQAARQDVVLRLATAYFDVILGFEELRAIQAEKIAVEAQLQLAERSFKEGETTIADVKEAQAKWDIVQAQEVAQKNTLQIRQTSLQALIGERVSKVQTLKVRDLTRLPPTYGNLDDWTSRARSRAFPVLFETLGLAAAEKEVARQSAAYKPSLDFVATLGAGRSLQRSRSDTTSAVSEDAQRTEPSQSSVDSQTTTSGTRNGEQASGSSSSSTSSQVQSSANESVQSSSYRPASNSRTSSTQYDAYVGFRLNIPLYDGGFTNSKVREALARQEQKNLELEKVQADAALATETAFLEAQGFFAEASALRTAEQSGEVALKSNQMGYQAGVRINSDILNAQQQLFKVRRDLINAQVSALLATLRLKASAGGLADDDVMGLKQWLE